MTANLKLRLKKLCEEKMSPYGSIRISEGCIVNCRHVKDIDKDKVILKDIDTNLKVSRRKKQECIKFLRAYRLKSSKYI